MMVVRMVLPVQLLIEDPGGKDAGAGFMSCWKGTLSGFATSN
jgi:hypothetical protein